MSGGADVVEDFSRFDKNRDGQLSAEELRESGISAEQLGTM